MKRQRLLLEKQKKEALKVKTPPKVIKPKPLFLMCSDSAYMATGFGDVSLDILRSVGDEYACHQIGWQHVGQAIWFEKWFIHPAGPDMYRHNYGSFSIPRFLEKHPQTKAFMTLQDIHCLDYIPQDMPKENRPPWIAYFPIDTHDIKQSWVNIASDAEFPTTYSKFAHELLAEDWNLETHYVPHGIDTKLWSPVAKFGEKNKLKRNFTLTDAKGKRVTMADKFVVGMIGRFNPRKMLQHWLGAFAKFAKDKDDVIAYWHCDPSDPMADFQLLPMLVNLGIEDKFVHTTQYAWWKPVPDPLLVMIANLFDVHFYPTGGEGFGLTVAKTMACGVPNLMTDYTTAREFLGDPDLGESPRGELLEIERFINMRGCQRPWINIDKAAEKLSNLYYDEDLRKEYSTKSMDFIRKNYDLKTVVRPQFINLINKAINSA